MFGLILTLAIDTAKIDTMKLETFTVPNHSLSRESRFKSIEDGKVVSIQTKDLTSPERLSTCYEGKYGECWSEN